jgi:hypothetical protein
MPVAVKLTPGLYEGIVKAYYPPNNTIKVKLKADGAVIPCIWAVGVVSAMVGFKTSYYPPMKTEVVVFWPGTSQFGWVIGSKPSNSVDAKRQRRTMTGDDAYNYAAQQTFHVQNSNKNEVFVGHKPPVDLAEGEINMENWMGVGLSLLRNLSSLQAGDLARIECHLLDDMVRIISDTFRHYTAFGDFKVSNDGGKLNVIWNGTKSDFEALGNQHATDLKAKMSSPTSITEDLNSINQMDDGRWRFSQFLGWLGNFINVFVTDPVNSLGQIAEGQFRSGKARIHINDDGAVLVQSVTDIVLEKVVRIPVPNQLRKEDDPKGDLSDAEFPNSEYLKNWTPSNTSNVFEMAYQLREYARWLNNTHSLSRFYQMTRDWEVPSEAQTPTPDINSDETDKLAVNARVSSGWRIAYATIRIYRDGSIQTVDAYGNAITTTATGIQISTPKSLLLQAGASVNIVAGTDVNILAHNNVGITAVTSAIRLKAQSAFMLCCTAGNFVYEAALDAWHNFIGGLSVNNNVQISPVGIVNVTTGLNVPLINTDIINTQNSVIVTGSPATIVTIPIPDIFLFQTAYDSGNLYQTFTQQMLADGDIRSSGQVWHFSDNAVAGKGSPWPGAGAQELTTKAGDKLNKPSSNKKFTSTPATMTQQDPQMITD